MTILAQNAAAVCTQHDNTDSFQTNKYIYIYIYIYINKNSRIYSLLLAKILTVSVTNRLLLNSARSSSSSSSSSSNDKITEICTFVTCSKSRKVKEGLADWMSQCIQTQMLFKNIQTNWSVIRPFQTHEYF